jgi:hypothetical protein
MTMLSAVLQVFSTPTMRRTRRRLDWKPEPAPDAVARLKPAPKPSDQPHQPALGD